MKRAIAVVAVCGLLGCSSATRIDLSRRERANRETQSRRESGRGRQESAEAAQTDNRARQPASIQPEARQSTSDRPWEVAGPRTKLAVYRTNPSAISDQLAENLARFDLIVLDFDAYAARPEGVARIKQLNPRVKILMYFNPMELFDPGTGRDRSSVYGARPLQRQLYQFISQSRQQWWMQTTDGQPVIYWQSPPMRMLNLSTLCPEVEGQRWCEFVARWHLDHTLSDTTVWDGVFMDNTWENVSWVPEYLSRRDHRQVQFDLNGDGQPESNQELDRSWADGVRRVLENIRQAKGGDFLIIGNKPNLDFTACDDGTPLCNGKMSENFPDPCFQRDWLINMYHFRQQIRMGMEYSILSSHDLTRQGSDQSRRFGLTSALMFGGYYSFRQDSARWYPEYDQLRALGEPVGSCHSPFQVFFAEYFESDQWRDGFAAPPAADFLASAEGERWYPLVPGEELRLPSLESGRYLVTFRYRVADLIRVRPQLLLISSDGRRQLIQQWSRWNSSVCHEQLTIEQPGSILIVAQGEGESQGKNRQLLINDVEVWRDGREGTLWWREFTNGWAVCNPSDAAAVFRAEGVEVTVAPRDGAIVLQRN